jgi:hypothetical protein
MSIAALILAAVRKCVAMKCEGVLNRFNRDLMRLAVRYGYLHNFVTHQHYIVVRKCQTGLAQQNSYYFR